eukprot:3133915-Amphidinium_carterae.1
MSPSTAAARVVRFIDACSSLLHPMLIGGEGQLPNIMPCQDLVCFESYRGEEELYGLFHSAGSCLLYTSDAADDTPC